MLNFEIFFDDLKPEVQEQLLSLMKEEQKEDMNWDIFPIAVIDIEEDENDRD